MAETRTLARPYAQAVFELAHSSNLMGVWSDALAAISAVVSNPDVHVLMGHPSVSRETLADAVIDIARDDLHDDARNLVHLLARNDRLALAPHIAEQFEELRARAEQRVDVDVVSAAEFSDEQKQALSKSLEKRLSASVRLALSQDPDMIGGAIIRAGDMVIDGSLRAQLARMQHTLAH